MVVAALFLHKSCLPLMVAAVRSRLVYILSNSLMFKSPTVIGLQFPIWELSPPLGSNTVRPCIASLGMAPLISHRLYSVVRKFTCPCTLVRSSNWSPLGPAALFFLALAIASSTSSHVIGYLRPLLLARGTGFHLILNGGILGELSLPRNCLSFCVWAKYSVG